VRDSASIAAPMSPRGPSLAERLASCAARRSNASSSPTGLSETSRIRRSSPESRPISPESTALTKGLKPSSSVDAPTASSASASAGLGA
jgi:hypothetical protein